MKIRTALATLGCLLALAACNNRNGETVEDDIQVYEMTDDSCCDEGPRIMRDVAKLEGEWFETHAAVHRLVLFGDGTFFDVGCYHDGRADEVTEGSYTINYGTIILTDLYGNVKEGLVKYDERNIYLDLLGCGLGWMVETDPSQRMCASALRSSYGCRDEYCGSSSSSSSMDAYRWLEGRWRVSYAGMTSELRICDFGGGLWMMTYWIDGVKEDEGTIDVYDGALHFEGKRGGGMYFPLDTYNHTLYADGNKTIPFRYAGSLM